MSVGTDRASTAGFALFQAEPEMSPAGGKATSPDAKDEPPPELKYFSRSRK
jgi:hypothetical protein